MQLTFTHFFRPKWQHPKPGVRRKAVHNLNPELSSDQQILLQLARLDQDIEVRCSALSKLDDPTRLLEIAQTDPVPQVRNDALRRFCRLICQCANSDCSCIQAPAENMALIDQISDPDILTHIALNATQLAIQLHAVERIELESALVQLVHNAGHFQIRQCAAEGIRDPELIDRLIKQCGHKDKGVQRILRETRERQKQEEKRRHQQQEQCRSLLDSLHKLSLEEAGEGYAVRFNALLQRWEEFDADLRTPLQQQFEPLSLAIEEKLQAFQERQQRELELQENRRQRQQLVAEFKAYCQSLPDTEACWEALAQRREQFQQRWQQLQSGPETTGEQTFSDLDQALASRIDALKRLHNRLPEVERLLQEEPGLDQAEQQLKALDWPHRLPPEPPVAALRAYIHQLKEQRKAQSQQRQEQQNQFGQLLESLQESLDQGQLQTAAPLVKQLTDLLNGDQVPLSQALRQRHQRLNARYQELSNWQLFATRPKLEEICEAMEALAERDLDGTERSQQLKALQQEWKSISANHIPRPLRNRFQQASSRVYEHCQGFFEAQKQQRQDNLEQRQQLLEKLRQTLQQVEQQSVDFKTLAGISRELKQQWRQYSPVDRAPGKKLQSQFNKLLEQTDQLLAADHQANADSKRALVEQVRELLQADDPVAAQEQAKELQKQWKQIGPARRKQEQSLWREFRALCNELFERPLPAPPSPAKPGVDRDWQQVERRHQLCEALEMQLLTEATLDQELQEAWHNGSHPKSPFAEQLQQRFDWLFERERSSDEIDQRLQESEQALRLLCIRKEILTGAQTPEADQVMRMEYQLKHLQAALEQHSATPCEKELLTLEKLWYCVPFNQCHQELRNRFRAGDQ